MGKETTMKITWLGHAAFLLETGGVKIVTDPYDSSVGYKPITMPVDIATVSHDHFDHNHVKGLAGNPQTVKGSGKVVFKEIAFTGVPTYHDATGGSERGDNTVFVMEAEGMRVCHLGDLGHTLSAQQVEAIGPVDILFLPVGGTYTVDAAEATKTMQDLNPKVVIPMHFKTEVLGFPIAGVDAFTTGKGNVKRQGAAQLEVSAATLPDETQIVLLDHLL